MGKVHSFSLAREIQNSTEICFFPRLHLIVMSISFHLSSILRVFMFRLTMSPPIESSAILFGAFGHSSTRTHRCQLTATERNRYVYALIITITQFCFFLLRFDGSSMLISLSPSQNRWRFGISLYFFMIRKVVRAWRKSIRTENLDNHWKKLIIIETTAGLRCVGNQLPNWWRRISTQYMFESAESTAQMPFIHWSISSSANDTKCWRILRSLFLLDFSCCSFHAEPSFRIDFLPSWILCINYYKSLLTVESCRLPSQRTQRHFLMIATFSHCCSAFSCRWKSSCFSPSNGVDVAYKWVSRTKNSLCVYS